MNEQQLINDIADLFGIGIDQRTHVVIMANARNALERSRRLGEMIDALALIERRAKESNATGHESEKDGHQLVLEYIDDLEQIANAALAAYRDGDEK